jgi:hypothetical protein
MTNISKYLTHYWPISCGQMLDNVGGSDMTQGNLTEFTTDRFGNVDSALSLMNGWAQIPSNTIYFDTLEFTITVWVATQSNCSNCRVLDIGNGQRMDNIIIALSSNRDQLPYLRIYSGPNKTISAQSSSSLTLGSWQFLAATFNGTNVRIYIDGLLCTDVYSPFTLTPIQRTKCFVGKSNWLEDDFSSFHLDELRFYNKSLSQEEINLLMKESMGD